MRVASGLYLNALNQAVSPLVGVVSTIDAYYPATNMWDRRADLRARWSAADGSFDEKIMFDLNVVPGGNCDALTFWSLVGGIGTLSLCPNPKLDGTNSIQLSHTANALIVGTPFKLRAGQSIGVIGGVRCTVGGASPKGVTLVLRNMVTGRVWHQPDASWIAAAGMDYNNGYVIRSASDSWVELLRSAPQVITVEDFAACGRVDSPDFRFEFHVWTSGGTTVTGLVDALYAQAGIELCSIFGSNGSVENVPGWYFSTDGTWGGAATKLFDLAPAGERILWKRATTPVYERFQGITIPANIAANQLEPMREIGELVLAQMTVLPAGPGFPVTIDYRTPAYRVESPTGLPYVSPLIGSAFPPRKPILSWAVKTKAEADAIRDEIYLRTRGGADPLVFLANATEDIEEFLLHGFTRSDVRVTMVTLGQWTVEVELSESPLF